ncbi:putative T7SS-secreted protein [Lentzea sp. NPDC059081]|uniref:putative T7SS-secreted protein n=1 Tax=Lentzea sp. NPDC059081 TaxID=3346719 RepID=UPI00368AD2F1
MNGGYGVYGNPDELDRIAGEIEKRAESVRTRGTEMNDRARTMRWQSIAAERCRETVEGDRRKLFQAAEGLDGAAAALRRHAQEVREMIAAIKRIGEAVTSWFTSAVDTFNQAVDAFNNAVRDIANGVADALGFGGGQMPRPPQPPWTGWKWGPDNLPPQGDKSWLEVGEYLRGQGVPA